MSFFLRSLSKEEKEKNNNIDEWYKKLPEDKNKSLLSTKNIKSEKNVLLYS